MKKRVVLSITALIMALCFLLVGCGKDRMSADKYLATVHDDYLTYSTASSGYLTMLKNTPMNSENGLKPYEDKIKPYFDTLEKMFSELKSINPPKEYDALHSKLKKSIELEEELLDLLRKLFKTESKAEAQKLAENYQETMNRYSEAAQRKENFESVAGEIIKGL